MPKRHMLLMQGIVGELTKEEKALEREISDAEAFVNRIERQYKLPGWLRWLYNLGFPMPDMPNMISPTNQAGNVSPSPGPPTPGSV